VRRGPIRRAAGTIGLLALVPTAVMLIKGNITLQVAAMRAGVTLGSVVVLARIGAWAVGWIADSAQESAAAQPAAEPTKQDGAR
jgi:F0F1-type ATP synthase membrane subunit c/vacuolar-type H+-ATPase subunit K